MVCCNQQQLPSQCKSYSSRDPINKMPSNLPSCRVHLRSGTPTLSGVDTEVPLERKLVVVGITQDESDLM